jgi:hypothetical protein
VGLGTVFEEAKGGTIMSKRGMQLAALLLPAGIALVAGTGAWAQRNQRASVSFDDLRLFFEFNSTDNDLGVQLMLDAEAWNRLRMIGPGPRQRKLLDLSTRGNLGKLGLTELFWESDEPSPEEVLDMFPAGKYQFEGRTVEGDRLKGEATLSHELPPAPEIVEPSSPGEEVDPDNTVIEWKPIPDLARFEIIVENEDVGLEMTVPLSADATTLHVPPEFLDPDTDYKVEVIAIAENGNKTIAEREFTTGS